MGVAFHLMLQPLGQLAYCVLTAALFVLGIWICGRAAAALGVHDHGSIVWDEIVGYLVTMSAAPGGWAWMAYGFLLFRVFDIFKPWPIRWLDRHVSGGFGIMIDDLSAGVYSAFLIIISAYFL